MKFVPKIDPMKPSCQKEIKKLVRKKLDLLLFDVSTSHPEVTRAPPVGCSKQNRTQKVQETTSRNVTA
ncbi:hypothetical protein CEXT_721681 [Caerostris extrusa]|uniref:Uncharacterized protein n=1 Tax=Caerostris extrusa TaxID=172846 RepID=A0AAV4XJL6_CAEEX|nr:hypothetical protein CEXT_721681 [Caerostris extrusa]